MIDIVTVFHNEKTRDEAVALSEVVMGFENVASHCAVDNITENKGFSKACNEGASFGTAPVIGFLNPDVQISGDFTEPVLHIMKTPNVVITGSRFNKSPREIRIWGCKDWVCGAALFVKRDWFTSVGGFDERFVWSWEETALIRTAQDMGKKAISIPLPISHESPSDDEPEVSAYKNKHFEAGAKLFYRVHPVKPQWTGVGWQ